VYIGLLATSEFIIQLYDVSFTSCTTTWESDTGLHFPDKRLVMRYGVCPFLYFLNRKLLARSCLNPVTSCRLFDASTCRLRWSPRRSLRSHRVPSSQTRKVDGTSKTNQTSQISQIKFVRGNYDFKLAKSSLWQNWVSLMFDAVHCLCDDRIVLAPDSNWQREGDNCI
jgi:hypothetical protein